MEFIIDNRENIKHHFIEKKVDWVVCKNMDIGDFCITYNNELVCIFERKTIEDLAASIKDGRYREQKKRLVGNYPKSKIMYIIEGDLTKDNKSIQYNKVSKDTIYSTIINVYLRDNINIVHTNNSTETIECLEQFCRKITKQGIDFIKKQTTEYKEDLINTVVHIKKKNMTPEIVFTAQLTCISGISINTAEVITKKYKTIKNLILELNTLSEKERLDTISSLTYTNNKDKIRKLGPKFAEKLLTNIGL